MLPALWMLLRLLAPMLPHTTIKKSILAGFGRVRMLVWRWGSCQARSRSKCIRSGQSRGLRNDVLGPDEAKERGIENAMDKYRGSSCPIQMACWPPLPMNWPISLASAGVRCPRKAQSRSKICRKSLRCDRSRKRDGTVREREEGVFSATETPLRLVFEHGEEDLQLTGEPADWLVRSQNYHISFRRLAVFVDFVDVAAGQDHALGDFAAYGSGLQVCDKEHLGAHQRLVVERLDSRTVDARLRCRHQLDSKQFVGVGVGFAALMVPTRSSSFRNSSKAMVGWVH